MNLDQCKKLLESIAKGIDFMKYVPKKGFPEIVVSNITYKNARISHTGKTV